LRLAGFISQIKAGTGTQTYSDCNHQCLSCKRLLAASIYQIHGTYFITPSRSIDYRIAKCVPSLYTRAGAKGGGRRYSGPEEKSGGGLMRQFVWLRKNRPAAGGWRAKGETRFEKCSRNVRKTSASARMKISTIPRSQAEVTRDNYPWNSRASNARGKSANTSSR
jgi:hypothetical protein